MNHIEVKLTEGAEETVEILASQIAVISDTMDMLFNKGRLKFDTIVLLIQSAIPGGMSKSDVKKVLNAIPQLKSLYLTKPYPGQK